MKFRTTTSNSSTRRLRRTAVAALAVVVGGFSLFGADAAVGPAKSASACVNHGSGDRCRGPRANTTQAEREESNRMSSGAARRTRRRQPTPAEQEAARQAACESACGEETADMLNRSLNDPGLSRLADAYGRACMRACDNHGTE